MVLDGLDDRVVLDGLETCQTDILFGRAAPLAFSHAVPFAFTRGTA